MNRSRHILRSLGLAVALAATVPACVVSASGRVRTHGTVVITDAPPEPKQETYEPRSGYVWVRGHWNWQGGQYVWMAGHWERERAGYAWADGSWQQRNNQWVWVEGTWNTHTDGAHGTVTVTEHDNDGGDGRVQVRDHRGDGGGTTTVVVSDHKPHQPPPELQAENNGTKSGYIWIRGKWDWDNQNDQWQWVPGHWERARAKFTWTDGHWEAQGDVWVWVDGSWNANPEEPRVKVKDHRHH